MNLIGRVLTAAGAALQQAAVVVVGPRGDVIGRGVVRGGALTADAETVPAWGVLIDDRPVLAVAVSADGETVDLGEIVLIDAGMAAPVFHAQQGRVFGAPSFIRTAGGGGGGPAAAPPPNLGVQSGLTFSGILGSASKQLGEATQTPTGLNLTGATITLKGVPKLTEDAVGFDFPNAELAATGVGLSQLSFTLKPPVEAAPPAPAPAGPTMPDVTGYTRDLAARKLAPLGRASEFTSEIVATAAEHGRVTRSIPAPGAPLETGAVIRLFIGKHEGS